MILETILERYRNAAEHIFQKIKTRLDVCAVAGSGIGEALNEFKIVDKINFSEIPNFPKPTVEGHGSEFLAVEIADKIIGVFSGRFHFYEGRTLEEVLSQVAVARLLGATRLILTNAAGGLNPYLKVGDLMLIDDVASLIPERILEGLDLSGGKTNDFFDENLKLKIRSILAEKSIDFRSGVYFSVLGPNYETPAEAKYLRQLGADAVGMSTATEAVAASVMGIEVAGASIITNVHREFGGAPASHDEVVVAAGSASKKIAAFLKAAISA